MDFIANPRREFLNARPPDEAILSVGTTSPTPLAEGFTIDPGFSSLPSHPAPRGHDRESITGSRRRLMPWGGVRVKNIWSVTGAFTRRTDLMQKKP